MVSKSGPAQAAAGTDVTYTVTIFNSGPDDSDSITLTDVIPAGMTFVSATPSAGCTLPPVGSGGTITCTIASLTALASTDFTFVFHIAPATPPGTFFTNVATASSPTDPNDENNSGIAVTQTPPGPQADVAITKTGPASAAPNSDVAYTITVTNFGPNDAQTVSWTDTLPAGAPPSPMTFVSFNQASGPAFNCGVPSATTTCTIATLPVNAVATFTFGGHIPHGTASGTIYTDTASVSAATNDPTPENNTSSTALTVSTVDVSVTKSGPATVTAGTNVTYTLTVANGGPDTADNVNLTDPLPAATTFVSLTQGTGPSAICSTPGPGGTGTVTCNWAVLANGASATFTLVIKAGNTTSISNTASVSTDSFDTNTSNDSSTATTTVTPSADVSVTKTGPASATTGTNVTYTVTVANAGPSDAASVSLTDTVPAGTTFVSESQTTGPTFACTTPAAGATGTITCTIATLPAGASATFSIVVNVSSGTTGTITNTATVSSSTSDPISGNNSASTTATVSAVAADLSIAKTSSAPAAGSVNFTIVVTNNGPADGQNVVMTDVLPAGTTLTSVATTQGSCTSGSTVTCALGTLPVGSSVTITIVVSIQSNAAVSNTATVAGSSPDPNLANNSSTAAVGAAAIPTLSAPTFALLALVLIVAGFWVLRRRRPASTR